MPYLAILKPLWSALSFVWNLACTILAPISPALLAALLCGYLMYGNLQEDNLTLSQKVVALEYTIQDQKKLTEVLKKDSEIKSNLNLDVSFKKDANATKACKAEVLVRTLQTECKCAVGEVQTNVLNMEVPDEILSTLRPSPVP